MFSLNNKSRKKDQRTYQGFQYFPTKKLKEIIDEPMNRGIDGHDYQPDIDTIKEVYHNRLIKQIDNEIELSIKQRYGAWFKTNYVLI